MTFLIGMAGALLCAALTALGFYSGWRLYPRFHRAEAPAITQEERRKLLDQQEAFKALMNYSVEDAYGMNSTAED